MRSLSLKAFKHSLDKCLGDVPRSHVEVAELDGLTPLALRSAAFSAGTEKTHWDRLDSLESQAKLFEVYPEALEGHWECLSRGAKIRARTAG